MALSNSAREKRWCHSRPEIPSDRCLFFFLSPSHVFWFTMFFFVEIVKKTGKKSIPHCISPRSRSLEFRARLHGASELVSDALCESQRDRSRDEAAPAIFPHLRCVSFFYFFLPQPVRSQNINNVSASFLFFFVHVMQNNGFRCGLRP